ncbi:MAG: NAD-dependent epimerase/dehydratase family protein [Candidatus Magnetomorum sp.]|nr:NAD-dependent epimerase/dehydratase family protein [Candidatus Magnetomorum sp.]
MSKKIMIAGASGYIGMRVCQNLYQKGYTVFALVRPETDVSSIAPWVKGYFYGDLQKRDSINDILDAISAENISHMISSVGSVNYHQSYEVSRGMNVETTQNIITIALQLQKRNILKKLVFIGSVASRGFLPYPLQPNEWITELSDYYVKNTSIYSDVKKEATTIVEQAIKKDQLKAVIIEPGSLVGKPVGNKSTTSTGLIRKIIKGIPVLKGGASYTSVYKLAEGIVLALEKGTIGETYLLGGENMTMVDLARLVKKLQKEYFPNQIINHWIPILTLPEKLCYLLGYFNIILNTQQALLGNAFHYIDDSKAENQLGYTHTVNDLNDAIVDVLKNL